MATIGLNYDIYPGFAAINSRYFKAGEEAEIIAGTGSFNKYVWPTIVIDNRDVPLDADGAAHYKFKASDKVGKHIIPVKIYYIDREGKRQTITKNIEYTVAEETNQKE
jgi:hypothetical protein